MSHSPSGPETAVPHIPWGASPGCRYQLRRRAWTRVQDLVDQAIAVELGDERNGGGWYRKRSVGAWTARCVRFDRAPQIFERDFPRRKRNRGLISWGARGAWEAAPSGALSIESAVL